MEIRQVSIKDLPAILHIEQLGFNEQEAGNKKQYQDRIKKLKETFLVAEIDRQVAGFVVGPVTKEQYVEDWMYEHTPTNLVSGGNQIVFTIAVDPKFQGQHVGSTLLGALEKDAKVHKRETISLTSLEKNLPFYLKNGFENKGIAASQHAGETWYNLTKQII